jgi:PAS domain S-box-containing protein
LNERWTNFTGQSMGDGLGHGFMEQIHLDDRPGVMDAWSQARQTVAGYQAEYRLRAVDGSYTWMIDTASPHLANDGSLLGYVGSIIKNAHRKSMELAKEAGERRLRVATHAAGLGIWEWDLKTNQFLFSDTARAIFGFNAGDVFTFEAIEAVMHPEDLDHVRSLSASALDPSRRGSEPYRYRIIRPDGEVRWIQAHGEALFSESDGMEQAVSYIGTFRDITEQTEYENRILDSEERLRLAIEAGGIAVWELNLSDNTVTHSPELNRLYGFPTDLHPTIAEFQSRYAPGERERLEEMGRDASARGETELVTEVRHIMPDGAVRWLYLRAKTAAPNAKGEPRVIGVVMDVTERREAEERLKLVARELQHRVKNSVAVIQSIAEQTFKKRAEPDAVATFSGRLRALAAATDILTKNDWAAADIRDVLDRVLSPYSDLGPKSIALEGPYQTLPAKAATALAMASHELATNAVKYGALSEAGGHVRVSWSEHEGILVILWT